MGMMKWLLIPLSTTRKRTETRASTLEKPDSQRPAEYQPAPHTPLVS